jgi:N utilization substance protein B
MEKKFPQYWKNDVDEGGKNLFEAEFLTDAKVRSADKKMFLNIFRAATDAATDAPARYHALISSHMNTTWPLARMDPVLVALLWAGAAELAQNTTTSKAIIINEYINIAKGFAAEPEVKFVHVALDGMGHKLRP